ncbi:hypothetical protein COLO4_24581 [Corchorus olitorius]|uniref:Uncharacterized protein n=1 Tax=Corchorus olitorius TaxID=93759 RepID=A0A1R3I8Y3_9ROSI|nr:hypothetical protein COLO4_24581 [Corchorus olitorius]
MARGGPIGRPDLVRRNPVYDEGFEENRQRQPFRTRCTINGDLHEHPVQPVNNTDEDEFEEDSTTSSSDDDDY